MIALIAAAATFSVAPVFAETLSFNADLKGSSEVPPVNTQANGTLSATYDTTAKNGRTWLRRSLLRNTTALN